MIVKKASIQHENMFVCARFFTSSSSKADYKLNDFNRITANRNMLLMMIGIVATMVGLVEKRDGLVFLFFPMDPQWVSFRFISSHFIRNDPHTTQSCSVNCDRKCETSEYKNKCT